MRDVAKQKAHQRAYYLRNREKVCARSKAYQKAHPEKARAYQNAYRARNRGKENARERSGYLRRTYGITKDDFAAILNRQNHVCAICSRRCITGKALAVDHVHSTGRIRGLLCAPCNRGLGMFGDDPERLRVAIAYLEASCDARVRGPRPMAQGA